MEGIKFDYKNAERSIKNDARKRKKGGKLFKISILLKRNSINISTIQRQNCKW